MRLYWSLRLTRLSVIGHLTLLAMSWVTSVGALRSLSLTSPPPPYLWLLTNTARFLSIGESPPMDSLLSRTILTCLKARVASHSLHFLKDASSPLQLES
ncbi:hypothetical protein OIU78_007666 [Salix suchowensis]|nr:hypothetical protein OIU78_007666 [Salix suchowensis]